MIKTSEPLQNTVFFEKDKIDLLFPELEGQGVESLPSGTYFLPNRWIIEIIKKQVLSISQTASGILSSSGIELPESELIEYFSGTVASQTEPNNFQDTRILSPAELRQKFLAAIKRDEQKRIEWLEKEVELTEEEID